MYAQNVMTRSDNDQLILSHDFGTEHCNAMSYGVNFIFFEIVF